MAHVDITGMAGIDITSMADVDIGITSVADIDIDITGMADVDIDITSMADIDVKYGRCRYQRATRLKEKFESSSSVMRAFRTGRICAGILRLVAPVGDR